MFQCLEFQTAYDLADSSTENTGRIFCCHHKCEDMKKVLFCFPLKGTVQRDLRGVKSVINR
jgi:hypothetical protein